jgi:ribosomal protein L7/L12
MEYMQDAHNEKYKLIIDDVGDSYAKVFLIVKQLTGKSTAEIKEIFDSNAKVVAISTKRELNNFSIKLQKAGAKVKLELA